MSAQRKREAKPKPGTTPGPQVSTTPVRRTTAPSKPSIISVTATRKLPFEVKDVGPKHRRSLDSTGGISRAVVPLPRPGHAEMSGLETTTQRILSEQLVRLTALLLRAQATKTSHDSTAVRDHAYHRAQEVVDEELSRIITKLVNLQGPSPMHRVVALSQLSQSVARDIEKAVFTDDRAYLASFANEQRVRREEAIAAHTAFAHELATKEQALASVTADKQELERASAALGRKCQALEKELEKATRNQVQMHQNAVELRMQGLDFKARVDNRCARILASIQSRMGFIPAGIQKQVLYLKVLKAPGDPQYDEVRMHTHQRASKRRFDPGDEKRYLGMGISMGPRSKDVPTSWASRVLNDELPPTFPRPKSAPMASASDNSSSNGIINSHSGRSGMLSQDSSDVEMMPPSKPPKTQADWVRWATNMRPGAEAYDLLDYTSSNGATGGGSSDERMTYDYGFGSVDDDAEEDEKEDVYGNNGRSGQGEVYDDSSSSDSESTEDVHVGGVMRRGEGSDYLWMGRQEGSLIGER